MKKRDVEPLLKAFKGLDEEEKTTVEVDFQCIYLLANDRGTGLLLGEAEQQGVSLLETFEKCDDAYERAIWTFLNHSDGHDSIFWSCFRVAEADSLTFHSARVLKDLPPEEPGHTSDVLADIGDAISEIWINKAKGPECIVDHHFRPDGKRHYFIAYPEGYRTSDLKYHDSELKRGQRRPVEQVVFIFHQDEGTLELSSCPTKKEAEALQDIFCRHALGLAGPPNR